MFETLSALPPDMEEKVRLHALWLKNDPSGIRNPAGIRADFTGEDLSGLQFSGRPLSNAIFSDANLAGARFREAAIQDALFENANCAGADFTMASTDGTDFTNANLTQCVFQACDLKTSNFTGAILVDTDFRNAEVCATKLVKQNVDLRLVKEESLAQDMQQLWTEQTQPATSRHARRQLPSGSKVR